MREKGLEKNGLSRIAVSESLIQGVESCFLRLAEIEVTKKSPQGLQGSVANAE